MSTPPNHAYYRGCAGAWRCELAMTITEPAALRESGMAWADRLSLRMLAVWPRWLGRILLSTTVTYDPAGEVLHTTVVTWLGIPLMRSTERITLDADGRAFEIHGQQRVLPAVWARRSLSGTGSIDATGTKADYSFEWLGAPFRQTTVRAEDLVTVTQQGPGFGGVQQLARRS